MCIFRFMYSRLCIFIDKFITKYMCKDIAITVYKYTYMYVTYMYINIYINVYKYICNANIKEAVSPEPLHLTQKRVKDTLMKVPKDLRRYLKIPKGPQGRSPKVSKIGSQKSPR